MSDFFCTSHLNFYSTVAIVIQSIQFFCLQEYVSSKYVLSICALIQMKYEHLTPKWNEQKRTKRKKRTKRLQWENTLFGIFFCALFYFWLDIFFLRIITRKRDKNEPTSDAGKLRTELKMTLLIHILSRWCCARSFYRFPNRTRAHAPRFNDMTTTTITAATSHEISFALCCYNLYQTPILGFFSHFFFVVFLSIEWTT